MRVVIDTNVLVSGLLTPSGACGQMVELLLAGRRPRLEHWALSFGLAQNEELGRRIPDRCEAADQVWRRSSRNSDAGATLVTSRWSRARVQAT